MELDLLSPEEAAEMLGLSPGTLANWRYSGTGPAYYKLGRKVFYSRKDIKKWLRSCGVRTADYQNGPQL